MITKLEIDGFKTFHKFEMEFSPFTIIAGANASGKSNLFDALELLSRLSEIDIKTAFSEQRGEAIELFTKYDEEDYAEKISFGIELLVDKKVRDNWGGEAELKYTRLRYDLVIRRVINERGLEDLIIEKESLLKLSTNLDYWSKEYIPKKVQDFWRPKVPTGKRGIPYISTSIENGVLTINLLQDGRPGGGKKTPAKNVLQTVLSGVNSVDFPHAFAAKEEMRKWRFLQLNPEVLREPSSYSSKDVISHDGKNLAAALYRIKSVDSTVLKDIARRLNNLLPTLVDIDVYNDTLNKQFVIKVKNEDGREFSSRVLSEGTLRLLALCIFLYDDTVGGLICFEEPENGIHPYRIKAMIDLLNDLSVDFEDTSLPLRQVLVNTHSPVLVGEVFGLSKNQLVRVWFSRLVTKVITIKDKKRKFHTTKTLPVTPSLQLKLFETSEEEMKLTLAELKLYLQSAKFPEHF